MEFTQNSPQNSQLSSPCAQLLSCVQLFGTPKHCNPTGSSVHVIFQERILEWIAISFSRGSSQPRDQTCISCVSCIGTWILYHCTIWESSPLLPPFILSFFSLYPFVLLVLWGPFSEPGTFQTQGLGLAVFSALKYSPQRCPLGSRLSPLQAFAQIPPSLWDSKTMPDKTTSSPGPITISTPNPSPLSLLPLVTIWQIYILTSLSSDSLTRVQAPSRQELFPIWFTALSLAQCLVHSGPTKIGIHPLLFCIIKVQKEIGKIKGGEGDEEEGSCDYSACNIFSFLHSVTL